MKTAIHAPLLINRVFILFLCVVALTAPPKRKGADPRTFFRGTTKRLFDKHDRPRRLARALSVVEGEFGRFRKRPIARATAKLFCVWLHTLFLALRL
jgi:hypothetical protein